MTDKPLSMYTIQDIITHPRYREFAQSATEHGKEVVPDAFPWRCMGWTDREIAEGDLRCEGGDVLGAHGDAWVADMIHVVRQAERDVLKWWTFRWWAWWSGWVFIDHNRAARAKPLEEVAASQPAPGMLF